MDFIDRLRPEPFKIRFMEDNQTAISVLRSGKNPTMRHLNRTHKISVSWLTERVKSDPQIRMEYCDSNDMAADIFTKEFYDKVKWQHAVALINIASRRVKPSRPEPSAAGGLTKEKHIPEHLKDKANTDNESAELERQRLISMAGGPAVEQALPPVPMLSNLIPNIW